MFSVPCLRSFKLPYAGFNTSALHLHVKNVTIMRTEVDDKRTYIKGVEGDYSSPNEAHHLTLDRPGGG